MYLNILYLNNYFVKMPFNDLRIYQTATKLSKEVDELVNKIPNNWKIKEVNQIKRSSSSVAPNIAEGCAKQIYPKEYIRYLNIALGSSDETQSHIFLLYNKGYISKTDYDYFTNQYKNLSIKILNLIHKLRNVHNIPYK